MNAANNPILLYDGVCGLCNRLVQFTLRHDHNDKFRFAALQGAVAAQVLARHRRSAAELDTFYIVTNPDQPEERIWARSDAVILLFQTFGSGWRVIAELGRYLPSTIRDGLYDLIARNRYRIFGKLDQCPLPDPRHQDKFIDH